MKNPFEKQEGPEFRVVGGASEEIKKEAKEELKGYFGEKHLENLSEERRKELENLEYPKTLEELELIDFANKKTNELMEKVGVSFYDVPKKNLHIVPPDLYKKACFENESAASTFQSKQAVVYNAPRVRNNPVYFGKTTFHELMHLKSHFSMEVEEIKQMEGEESKKDVKIEKTPYRAGLGILPSQKLGLQGKYHEHFRGLNEAVIAWEEKDYIDEMFKLQILKKERDRLESNEALGDKKKIAKEKNISIDDIVWVREDGKDYEVIGYPNQREVYGHILRGIQEKFSDKYKDTDEVRLEFLRGLFTGRLLTIAKLIEKTFGKGSFEVLGMMDNEPNSAVKTLEYMRRARIRQEDKNI